MCDETSKVSLVSDGIRSPVNYYNVDSTENINRILQGIRSFITSDGVDWNIKVKGQVDNTIVITESITIECLHDKLSFVLRVRGGSHEKPYCSMSLYSSRGIEQLVNETIECLKVDQSYLSERKDHRTH